MLDRRPVRLKHSVGGVGGGMMREKLATKVLSHLEVGRAGS